MKLLLLLLLFACTHRDHKGELPIPESLEEAVNSSERTKENTERDEYQHPLETLAFFGVSPEMAVVEISPGAGYYTEILAPYLAKSGQYYMAVPRMTPNPPAVLIENERKLQEILLRHSEVRAKTKLIPLEPTDKRNKLKSEYADVVLSFNHIHNWLAKNEAQMAFKFSFDVLKPGGTFGVVQHRISEKKKRVPKSGYLTEREVITLAEKAGFKLVARSEINANPKDTADYPDGVWVLPPTYRLGDKDRDKYEDIGESDRMTLKFIRPARK